MLAVTSVLPEKSTSNPVMILVHGAANSAKVWTYWQQELANIGWESHAIDLSGHGKSPAIDLSGVTMKHYASDVSHVVSQLNDHPVIIGWSMGGLVGMMVAADGGVTAGIGLEPSPPAAFEDESARLRTGVYDSKEYGIVSLDPRDQPSMPDLDAEERSIALSSLGPESRLARDERRRGIVIESLQCPFLLVSGSGGSNKPSEPYGKMGLDADQYSVDGVSHWGLVLNKRSLMTTVSFVCQWLDRSEDF